MNTTTIIKEKTFAETRNHDEDLAKVADHFVENLEWGEMELDEKLFYEIDNVLGMTGVIGNDFWDYANDLVEEVPDYIRKHWRK